ncbi:MAG: hypothetical protein ACK53L_16885, partial [Pirellulaceae bacterium]
SCGAAKGKKCSCDGGCGSGYAKKMDRNDALTPQEYLAACELGIQGRSVRATRTNATVLGRNWFLHWPITSWAASPYCYARRHQEASTDGDGARRGQSPRKRRIRR